MISLFTPSLSNLSISYLSICIPPSPNPPSRLLGQFDYLNIKNSSTFRNCDRTTGIWQDDRQDDRQRILDEYMIDKPLFKTGMEWNRLDGMVQHQTLLASNWKWPPYTKETRSIFRESAYILLFLLWKRIQWELRGGAGRHRMSTVLYTSVQLCAWSPNKPWCPNSAQLT
jgi:hypothetical protein